MILNLIDNGNNVIISLQNRDKDVAKTILMTMYNNVLEYYKTSQYAIQADVYRFAVNSKNKFKRQQTADDEITLDLDIPEPFEAPTDETVESIFIAENYVNRLIKHVSKFETKLSKQRTDFIVKHQRLLVSLAKNNSEDELKEIVKKMVKVK